MARTKDRIVQGHDITRRDRKNFDVKIYVTRIGNIVWDDFYKCKNINLINDMFVTRVGDILGEEAPLKGYLQREKKKKKKKKNWLTADLKSHV